MADQRSPLLLDPTSPVRGKSGGQESPERPRKLSYLERSTARRDSALPGVGKEKHSPSSVRQGRQSKAEARVERDSSGEAQAQDLIFKTVRRPEKLLDKKAAGLAKRAKQRKAEASRLEEGANPRAKARAENAKLLAALVLILAIGAVFYYSVPKLTKIEKLEVRGLANVGQEEILSRLAMTEETNLVGADLVAMRAGILADPKIADAKLRRVFPDTLAVDISERVPVACVLVTEDFVTKSIAIDEKGIAFAYLESLKASPSLPVLSGIRFTKFSPGQSLPGYLVPLLGDLALLLRESPEVLGAFSEIKIEKISNSEAEVLLYPAGKKVPVRMPARLTAANLRSALLVLDILAGRQGSESIYEIDFRTGTIVYKTKEAQAG